MNRPTFIQMNGDDSDDAVRARGEGAEETEIAGIEWLIDSAILTGNAGSVADGWRPPLESDDLKTSALSLRLSSTDLDHLTEQCCRRLSCARTLGAKLLTLRLPSICPADPTLGFASYQDGLNAAHTLLRALRFESETTGVVVSLLAPQDGFFVSPVEARELIDDIKAWNVGVTVDIDRVNTNGHWSDWLGTLGSRVQGVIVGSRVTSNKNDCPISSMSDLTGVLDEFVPDDRPVIIGLGLRIEEWSTWCGRDGRLPRPGAGVGLS